MSLSQIAGLAQVEDDNLVQFLKQRGKSNFSYFLANAQVIDGMNKPAFRADVLIDADTIAYLGKVDADLITCNQFLDLTGFYLTPGFIDPHAHGNALQDDFTNFLAMGITTIVLGQDGSSPVNQKDISPTQYLQLVNDKPKQINMAFLCGHGSIRSKYLKGQKITPVIISQMQQELTNSMQAGCFGMSTGLEYYPGYFATDEELIPLAKTIGSHRGIIMSHMRNEDDESLEQSIDELMRQGRHCKVHISHLKSVYGQGMKRGGDILAKVRKAQHSGMEISADVYPYSASYTGLGIVFPKWAKTRLDFERAVLDRSEELREHLSRVVTKRNGPEATLFASGPFIGKTLAEVAAASGKSYVDILLQLGPTGASAAYFVMDESLQAVFINDPEIMICTDGGPTMRHPRAYGAHAKVLAKYVRELGSLPLVEAIYKMTHLPAKTLNLDKRGSIAVGQIADLNCFDLEQVQEHATYEDPFQLSTGIEFTFLAGNLIRQDDGKISENWGRLLTHSLD